MIEAQIAKMLAYGHFSRELVALYLHRIVACASASAVGAFTVIFVYQLFDGSLFAALVVFGAMYLGTGIMVVPAAQLLNRFGIRTVLLFSFPFIIVGHAALFFLATGYVTDSVSVILLLISYIVVAILYRVLYWIPYNTDMSILLDRSRRGTQVALLSNIADINVATMPFWAGLVVAFWGFGWLFLLAAALTLLSVIPLFWTKNRHEHYSWTYVETLRALFAFESRPLLWGYSARGVQDGVQIVLWPLLVFLLLDQEYIAVGAITALTFFAIIIIRFFTGRLFDDGKKVRILTWGAALSATGWIMKMAVVTPVAIFVVDTYHGVGRIMNQTAIDIFAFEQAADNGRFVDEYTVLKELSLSIGRTFVLLLAGIAAWFGGAYAGFGIALLAAAFATLGTIRLARQQPL